MWNELNKYPYEDTERIKYKVQESASFSKIDFFMEIY